MASKLDQSLDEMLSTQRKTGGGNRRRSTRRSTGPAKPAPAGGIQKNTKPARGNNPKNAPSKPTGAVGESKIVVSNLPKDVSEAQIKVCFRQGLAPMEFSAIVLSIVNIVNRNRRGRLSFCPLPPCPVLGPLAASSARLVF